MDSGKTTQGDGDERTAENVVRLPRDWLGPRDELVPMGSRASAGAPVEEAPADSLPPTAASFWDEDSGSLQAPMQAPANAWSGKWEPAVAEPTPPTPAPDQGTTHRRAPHGRSIPRPHIFLSSRSGFAAHRRSIAAVLGLLAAGLLVVLAVIGQTEGGTHTAGQTTASASKSARIVTSRGANLAPLRATPVVTQITGERRSHHAAKTETAAARSRARAQRAHASKLRHRHRRATPRPTQSTYQPVHTTTPTYTPAPATTPTTSAPSSGSTASSPPASTDRSTSSGTQHEPAFGSNGSLGPGSSPDS